MPIFNYFTAVWDLKLPANTQVQKKGDMLFPQSSSVHTPFCNGESTGFSQAWKVLEFRELSWKVLQT